MGSSYIWLKALHVSFMVTWFAGLFYLPRLYIYHAQTADAPGRERFEIMEKRLLIITTIGASITVVFGYLLIVQNTALVAAGWFQLKLALIVGLAVYHIRCYSWMQRLRGEKEPRDTRWLRWFNEIPVAFLLGIVLLAIAKPF